MASMRFPYWPLGPRPPAVANVRRYTPEFIREIEGTVYTKFKMKSVHLTVEFVYIHPFIDELRIYRLETAFHMPRPILTTARRCTVLENDKTMDDIVVWQEWKFHRSGKVVPQAGRPCRML